MPAMRARWQRLWTWVKLLLAVAIIAGVGWQFAKLLRSPELWDHPPELRPGWLAFPWSFTVNTDMKWIPSRDFLCAAAFCAGMKSGGVFTQ